MLVAFLETMKKDELSVQAMLALLQVLARSSYVLRGALMLQLKRTLNVRAL